jgi:hypothetical protein
MVDLPPCIRRRDLWHDWYSTKGRNRIEPSKNVNDCAGYCLKYLFKSDGYWQLDNVVNRWDSGNFALQKAHWFGM